MKHSIQELATQILHSPFVAGFAGAVVSVMIRGKASFFAKFTMVIAGMFCAGFIAPAICKWLEVEATEYQGAFAFGVGLLGLQITGGLLKLGEDIKTNPGKYIPNRWKK